MVTIIDNDDIVYEIFTKLNPLDIISLCYINKQLYYNRFYIQLLKFYYPTKVYNTMKCPQQHFSALAHSVSTYYKIKMSESREKEIPSIFDGSTSHYYTFDIFAYKINEDDYNYNTNDGGNVTKFEVDGILDNNENISLMMFEDNDAMYNGMTAFETYHSEYDAVKEFIDDKHNHFLTLINSENKIDIRDKNMLINYILQHKCFDNGSSDEYNLILWYFTTVTIKN